MPFFNGTLLISEQNKIGAELVLPLGRLTILLICKAFVGLSLSCCLIVINFPFLALRLCCLTVVKFTPFKDFIL